MITRNKRRRLRAKALIRQAAVYVPQAQGPVLARPVREPVERTPRGLVSPFYQWALETAHVHGRFMAYDLPDYAGGGQAPSY